jgi:hypothetical protein
MLETQQVGNYTVRKAGLLDALRRERLAAEAAKILDGIEAPVDDDLTGLFFWPRVAGCVTPSISFEEFTTLPDTEILPIVDAAMKLNPHWFETPTEKN